MAKFNKNALIFSENELKELNFDLTKELEVIKAKKGIYLMLEKEAQQTNELDQKIFSLLKTKPLKEKVEGKFEKLLTKEELQRFNELIKEGTIIKFKLSKKYAKAIYKLKKELEEKNEKNFALEKDDFQVIENSEEAKNFSQKREKEIKEGKILGIKGFDGKYYIIKKELFLAGKEKILKELKEGIKSLQDLSIKTKMNESLVKGICELLKEEGEIMEKRKGIYAYIK